MKKLFASFVLFLCFIIAYPQKSYNLLVQANNIRVWIKPVASKVIPNRFLEYGEKVRIIDAIIEDAQVGVISERFCRIYRNGDNNTPYYLNISEVSIDLRTLKIGPSPSAVTDEKPINYIWVPLNNTFHKKGEIIFFNGKNSYGIYSFLNKAALNKSDMVDNKFTGFYNIESIVKCKVEGIEKAFFYCRPLKTPFNEENENEIYIDYFVARDNIDFQSFTHGNIFFSLLLDYAYKFPTGNVPDNFYADYLSSLDEDGAFSKMDEFKRQRIFNAGKTFMDSIFNERMKVFSVPLTNVFYSSISEYNFNNKSFTIPALSNTRNELTMLVNKFSSAQPATGSFINLPLFNPNLQMDIDLAESFTKEIVNHELNPYDSYGREVVLIVHFRYISAEKAKVLHKIYDTYISDFNYQKVIDSIEVYSGNAFTRSDVVITNQTPFPDKGKTKKWGTLYPKTVNSDIDTAIFTSVDKEPEYPGGDIKLFRNLHYPDEAMNNSIQGKVIVEFMVDLEGNVSNIKAISGPTVGGLRDEAIHLITRSGKWTPAFKNGHRVNSVVRKTISFSLGN